MRQFTYSLSQTNRPVSNRSQIWTKPLPLDRIVYASKPKDKTINCDMNYGDYFRAARIFLEKNKFETLTRAATYTLGRVVNFEDIQEIRVSLEKHGQFYHPARVITAGDGFCVSHVLNVAVSKIGKDWIKKEYDTLKKLQHKFSYSYVPVVFEFGEVHLKKGEASIRMFLGEWFDGFNEFHVSKDPDTDQNRIMVWDYDHGDFCLSLVQATHLYKQMAKILTSYYNLETFEQIFSWHHAAGDFVLKLYQGQLDVKLVTVRQYLKLFKNTQALRKSASLVLNALLVFFLYLSIRMRLDRLDGVGPIVWSGQEAVVGTVKGFFDALGKKLPVDELPGPVAVCFHAYLQTVSEKKLLYLLSDIAATYSSDSPDIAVINQQLEAHAVDLYRAIRQA